MFDPGSDAFNSIALGVVIDTNDPQQMGRVRARVNAYGDTIYDAVSQIPWCLAISPLAGMVQKNSFTRGPDLSENLDSSSIGPIPYGFFNTPKCGSLVIVACLDGDPTTRIWLGCIHVEQTVHGIPHGRYFYDPEGLVERGITQPGTPEGPLSSSEDRIQPLYNNQSKVFKSRVKNFEWRTRGADHSVAGLTKEWRDLNNFISEKADDEDYQFTEEDANVLNSRMGYQKSRLEPDLLFESTGANFDPQVYCWVTPGFHAISMDDSAVNCRMRFRTTTGHQIILDDTNERIYISTNLGENWVEMDSDGSVDIWASQKVSIHSASDINLTADKTIRMYAKKGIHAYSEEEIRIQALKDVHFKTDMNFFSDVKLNVHETVHQHVFTYVKQNYHLQIDQKSFIYVKEQMNTKTDDNFVLEAGKDINLIADQKFELRAGEDILETTDGSFNTVSAGATKISANGGINLNSTARVLISSGASGIHLNGPQAVPATSASPSSPIAPILPENVKLTFWTNRVPTHESWGRISTAEDTTKDDPIGGENSYVGTHEPNLPYDDVGIGRENRERGPNWHR